MEVEPSHLYLGDGERLHLPRRDTAPCSLDEYLKTIPRVVSSAEELNCSDNKDSLLQHASVMNDTRKCLNVLQGEVAHASAEQAHVVVSAEATTCHVVALRSVGSAVPLVSLAHIDKPYDTCLEEMVRHHIRHHDQPKEDDDFGFFMQDDEDDALSVSPEETSSSFLPNPLTFERRNASMPDLRAPMNEPIEMELHMVGGYLDKEGTSQQLSTHLLEQFSDLASKYQDSLKISLSTAAISCMNTSPKDNKPRSRGLGIDTRTGQVFPVHSSLPAALAGPANDIRAARAFCDSGTSSLAVIHDATSSNGQVRIEPFAYEKNEGLSALLNVPDDVLLSIASTSPETESKDFCKSLRRTLSFVNTVPSETVFGADNDRPLVYTRSTNDLNQWEEDVAVPNHF